MGVAHGGQVVVSASTSSLVRDGSVELVDLGEHRLRDLSVAERVFQVRAPGLERVFPPLRSVDALPGTLPRQVTTFVGREAEIVSLSELVARSSLVTLTGVGGVGKTRLALEIAAEVIGEFPDGAWLCEFAPVTDPDAVWETVAACLRVQSLPGRTHEESVLDYLAAKRLLLVLDNCEHLLDASARLVAAIEHRCPRVAVLATSTQAHPGLSNPLCRYRQMGSASAGSPTQLEPRRGRRTAALCTVREYSSRAFGMYDALSLPVDSSRTRGPCRRVPVGQVPRPRIQTAGVKR
jgi:hypothetical protein